MRKHIIVACAALAAVVLACGSAGKKDTAGPGAQTSAGASATAGKVKHTIKLEVTGPKTADVTYGLAGDTSQGNGVALPWTKDLTSDQAFIVPSVVAQSKAATAGTITCRITVDGKVVKENTSSGQYAVVTCSG